MKVARIVTIPEAFVHITGVLAELKRDGVDLHLIASPGAYVEVLDRKIGARFIPIEIPREISLVKDFKALVQLWRLFIRERYDIVHSSTPKAGLLCAIAGRLAGISVRIHTFTGQRWETLTGFKRQLLIAFDHLIGLMNSWNYADSPGQVERLQQWRILHPSSSSCLGLGSYGGIDIDRFQSVDGKREPERARLGYQATDYVIAFLGRLCVDKGIPELVQAYLQFKKSVPSAKLLLIGPLDEELSTDVREALKSDGITMRGFQNQPELDLVAADVFCLPSHREGFGTVILEAAVLGLPSIGTKIPGLRDAIVDQETGLLVELKSSEQLTLAMKQLHDNPSERKKLGSAARERAIREFPYQRLEKLLLQDYRKLLNQK